MGEMCIGCVHRGGECSARCPWAYQEDAKVHECIHCGHDICEGDEYYDIDGEPWCEKCIYECLKYAELES